MPSLYAHEKQEQAPQGLLLGLAAKKQRGKDTAAEFLAVAEGFTVLSFAEPMKRCAAAAIGVSVQDLEDAKEDPHARIATGIEYQELGFIAGHSISVREYLQRVGTEAHRKLPEFGDSVWIDMMRAKVQQVGRYVITDARFENEQRMVKEMGGYVVQINRPGMDEADTHASEQVDHGLADFVIENDGSIADFYAKIEEVLAEIRASRAV